MFLYGWNFRALFAFSSKKYEFRLIVTGTGSVEEAFELFKKTQKRVADRGFLIGKWKSNESRLEKMMKELLLRLNGKDTPEQKAIAGVSRDRTARRVIRILKIVKAGKCKQVKVESGLTVPELEVQK